MRVYVECFGLTSYGELENQMPPLFYTDHLFPVPLPQFAVADVAFLCPFSSLFIIPLFIRALSIHVRQKLSVFVLYSLLTSFVPSLSPPPSSIRVILLVHSSSLSVVILDLEFANLELFFDLFSLRLQFSMSGPLALDLSSAQALRCLTICGPISK
ncbi:unnamed protein product [Dibothriocephalus latus]|uniref:Uncharacterized protein n=1 Tax=Dibothriocephalus latus TaxID=60516 RepID=A0A3P7MY05_DIBLA|nr:unnamed protein product [Dibothriocephalus latus]